jgi:hypothetical protein
MEIVNQILSVDEKHRYEGVLDDLYEYEALNKDVAWDYGLPTLTSQNHTNLFELRTKEQFIESINTHLPFLKNVSMDNLLLAGGVVSHFIQSKAKPSRDFDVFVYGLDETSATMRVNKFIVDMYNSFNHMVKEEADKMEKNKNISNPFNRFKILYNGSTRCHAYRNEKCVNLQVGDFEFQIIFRLYKSISEILHGFDLGSSAVGFDGQKLYFTTLSKFAYEYRCNIVDCSRRSTTYEHRLKKYFDRGFEIILPQMDFQKVRLNYHKYGMAEICELPHMVFSYKEAKPNKIYVDEFLSEYSNEKSDYNSCNMDQFTAFYFNLYHMIRDGKQYFSYAEGTKTPEIMKKKPVVNGRMIELFYDNIRNKFNNFKSQLDMKTCKKYINVVTVDEILTKLYLDDQMTTENKHRYLDQVIEKQKKLAMEKWKLMHSQEITQVDWITENPGRQTLLTSSFNPIIEDPKLWYGNYYTN